jgi:hypothetical protein
LHTNAERICGLAPHAVALKSPESGAKASGSYARRVGRWKGERLTTQKAGFTFEQSYIVHAQSLSKLK